MNDQEIIDYLNGSGNWSLSEKEEARFDDAEFCAKLDAQIFNCTCCTWWCPIEEVETSSMGEQVCTTCKEDEDDG